MHYFGENFHFGDASNTIPQSHKTMNVAGEGEISLTVQSQLQKCLNCPLKHRVKPVFEDKTKLIKTLQS